jgi:hypothetical protein
MALPHRTDIQIRYRRSTGNGYDSYQQFSASSRKWHHRTEWPHLLDLTALPGAPIGVTHACHLGFCPEIVLRSTSAPIMTRVFKNFLPSNPGMVRGMVEARTECVHRVFGRGSRTVLIGPPAFASAHGDRRRASREGFRC